MALRVRSLTMNLPFGLGGVQVDVTDAEARAAWDLYVEFATRIAVVPLGAGGSRREALNSLYSLFASTRDVLRQAGPEIASGPNAIGPLAIRVLNEGLRPFTARWHAELRDFETMTGFGAPSMAWPKGDEFDDQLANVQEELRRYVKVLATVAGVAQ